MSLEEALALSRNGARVLHDEAIAYAMREGIELLASATASPSPGTRIQVGPLPARVVGITHDQALELFEADDSRMLLEALHLAGAPLRFVDDRRVLVDSRNWPDRQAFTPPEGCVSRGAVAVVAAVGGGMDSHLSLAREGIACLEDSKIALRGWFSSELAVKWMVSVEDAEAAARALHALWIAP
jgi:aspartokinase